MLYREDALNLKVKNIVDLFEMNDKSEVTVILEDSQVEIYYGRVDYLQYTERGDMHDICALYVKALEVNGGNFIIYV